MPYLGDTNILLRLALRSDPQHALIRSALRKLRQQGEMIYYSPQNLVEFWNVCTRPSAARGGMGLSTAEADWATRIVERVFPLLPDNYAIHAEWRRIVVTHQVSGVQVHDARLVAVMRTHGITHLLTLDIDDFRRYPDITAVHPQTI